MRKSYLVISLLVTVISSFVPSALGTTYYVDSSVASSGNGMSWGTAWKSFSNITGLQPGDTVYVSGGATSQAYSVSNWTPTSGTSGNPITYKTARVEAGCTGCTGHDGVVMITSSGDWMTGVIHDVIIDGNVGGAQHWSVTASGFIWYSSGGNNARVRITYITVPNAVGGFHWDTAVSTTNTAVEIDHSRLVNDHDWINGADNEFFGGAGTGPGQVKVHDNYIQFSMWTNNHSCGNDVWIWAKNTDFYNNTVQGVRRATYTNVCPGTSQHSDVFQTDGSNVNFYNNTIIDPGESVYYQDTFGGAVSNIKIYNNLILHTFACNSVERGFDMNPENNVAGVTFTDMVIANNTFIDPLCNFSVRVGGNANHITPTRVYVVNNLEYPSGNGISVDPGVTVSNNYSGNSAQFVSYSRFGGASNDLHLTSSDTVARGQGKDMSTYFSIDKDGKPRPSGAWDIEAYQYSGSGSASVSPPTSLSAVIQ